MTPSENDTKPATDRDRYRVLLETSRRLSATLGPDELYAAIYRETAGLMEASGFYLALYDQSRDLARIVFYADEGEVKHVDHSFRASDSEVFRSQAAYLIDDDLQQGSLLVLGDQGTRVARSAVTAPIVLSGRTLGAISAQSYEPETYSQDDLQMLEGIADVAAVALQNSIQFTELERRRTEAERLEEIGRVLTSELDTEEVLDRVIAAVQEVLQVDGTAVWLCDLRNSSVCRVAESGGDVALPVGLEWDIGGELRRILDDERRPVVFENLHANPLVPTEVADHLRGGSAIGAPVIVSGRVEGVLTAGSRQPRRFTQEDTGVLQRLANQFAVALGNARLHADLHALSLTDPLTGLPNRRRLQIHLDHEIAAARRGRPLGIAIIDLDRFKHYNDTFGHVAGDEILKAMGRVLSEENRAMNLVARFGGDEFVSVLSDADLDGLRHYVDRVLARVGKDDTLSRFDISISCGIAAFDPETMVSVNDVLRAADSDLYAAKAASEADKKAAG
jgi:diguanylate cyclase (GGDEF)-like protein